MDSTCSDSSLIGEVPLVYLSCILVSALVSALGAFLVAPVIMKYNFYFWSCVWLTSKHKFSLFVMRILRYSACYMNWYLIQFFASFQPDKFPIAHFPIQQNIIFSITVQCEQMGTTVFLKDIFWFQWYHLKNKTSSQKMCLSLFQFNCLRNHNR